MLAPRDSAEGRRLCGNPSVAAAEIRRTAIAATNPRVMRELAGNLCCLGDGGEQYPVWDVVCPTPCPTRGVRHPDLQARGAGMQRVRMYCLLVDNVVLSFCSQKMKSG